MKIPRHKLENNTINSVFDSGSNNIITKKICPKGPKLCSAKCMASLHCLLYYEIWYHTCIKICVELNVIVLGKWVDLPQVDLEQNAFLRVRLVASLANENHAIMVLVLVGILNACFIFSILSYHKAFRADYI
jgi:type IV secretory pathway TrbL component